MNSRKRGQAKVGGNGGEGEREREKSECMKQTTTKREQKQITKRKIKKMCQYKKQVSKDLSKEI